MSGSKYILLFVILPTIFLSSFFVSTKKAEAGVLGGAIGAITAAHAVPHVPTGDTVGNLVMTTLKLAAKEVAQQMIEQMVKDTINWINNGFNGGPAYVTNPEQYFSSLATHTADGVMGTIVNGSDLGFLCSPFNASIKASLKFTYNSTYAQPSAPYACTASGIWNNIDGFKNNFDGGWDSWFQITQNDANNPYGAALQANIYLDSQVQKALGLAQNEYTINKGFLSFKDKDGNIKTPGTVIEAELNEHLNSGFSQLVNAKEFDDLIDAFMAQIIRKTVFPAKNQGLFSNSAVAYTNTNSGGSQTTQSPISCVADTQDAVVGDKVSWSATTNLPPTSKVTYSWSGEGVNGQAAGDSIIVTYATDGDKKMSLSASVSDITTDPNTGEETLTNTRALGPVDCAGSVHVVKHPPLKLLSCKASSLQTDYEQPVTWTATFSGGSGSIRSVKWSGDQPNPPQCKDITCGASIWPPALPPSPSVPYQYPNNGKTGTTVQTFSKDSTTNVMTSTLTRVYYKNNSTELGNVSADITVIDNDNNVLPLQNASCGSIFVRP